MRVTVQRSPFLTQSVAVRRSRRSLLRVMIRSPTLAWFPSASAHLGRPAGCRSRRWAAGALVELGDQLAGGGEHDRVQPGRSVGSPGGEDILGDGGEVADVDPAVVEVEAERLGSPSRRAREAAASAGSVKRSSSVSCRAPWVAWMSRRTPPAPIAASC